MYLSYARRGICGKRSNTLPNSEKFASMIRPISYLLVTLSLKRTKFVMQERPVINPCSLSTIKSFSIRKQLILFNNTFRSFTFNTFKAYRKLVSGYVSVNTLKNRGV